MKKILFNLLVTSVFFAGIQGASAVRTMNPDNLERRAINIGVQKPTYMQEKRITRATAKKKAPVVSQTPAQYKVTVLNNAERGIEKENAPFKKRIQGSKVIRLEGSRPLLLSPQGQFLPSAFSTTGRSLHALTLNAIPVLDPVIAKPIYHVTRSTTIKSK